MFLPLKAVNSAGRAEVQPAVVHLHLNCIVAPILIENWVAAPKPVRQSPVDEMRLKLLVPPMAKTSDDIYPV